MRRKSHKFFRLKPVGNLLMNESLFKMLGFYAMAENKNTDQGSVLMYVWVRYYFYQTRRTERYKQTDAADFSIYLTSSL